MTVRTFKPRGLKSRAVVVAALAAALCGVGAAPAAAHWRAPVKIQTIGNITAPATAYGTFTSRIGRLHDSGTYTETGTIVGDAIRAVKVFAGRRGTFEMHLEGFIVFETPTTATFRDGQWEFRNGTGAYSGLRGGGRPAVAKGSADLAARTVDVIHRGKARLGRTDRDDHGHHGHHDENR
jgi:hypothetical protein